MHGRRGPEPYAYPTPPAQTPKPPIAAGARWLAAAAAIPGHAPGQVTANRDRVLSITKPFGRAASTPDTARGAAAQDPGGTLLILPRCASQEPAGMQPRETAATAAGPAQLTAAPSRRSDYAELSRQVRQAGLMDRRPRR